MDDGSPLGGHLETVSRPKCAPTKKWESLIAFAVEKPVYKSGGPINCSKLRTSNARSPCHRVLKKKKCFGFCARSGKRRPLPLSQIWVARKIASRLNCLQSTDALIYLFIPYPIVTWFADLFYNNFFLFSGGKIYYRPVTNHHPQSIHLNLSPIGGPLGKHTA